jgi:AcrR family transcriptional regulator
MAAPLDLEIARAGRPRDDAREQAIVDAAMELLAEVGYEAMSMEAIAVRARSSKATIYRRWPGKAELVAEAMRRRAEPVLEDLPDTGSLRGDLLALADRVCASMEGVHGGLICGLAVAVRADPELGHLLRAHMHEYQLSLVADLVSRAEARDEIAPGADPNLILQVAPGVAFFHQMGGEPLDTAFVQHLVDAVLIPLLRPSTEPAKETS